MTAAPCDCGRTHARILRITGRNDDMLIVRGVNVYPSQVEAVIVGRPQLAPHYQLVVTREGVLDEVQIEVEAQPGVATESFAGLARELAHAVKVQVGISTRVTILAPGAVARSQGKAVRVRDLRKKEL
jgi:phenylacetate-CoA ligase